jgi:hypothetical protein
MSSEAASILGLPNRIQMSAGLSLKSDVLKPLRDEEAFRVDQWLLSPFRNGRTVERHPKVELQLRLPEYLS